MSTSADTPKPITHEELADLSRTDVQKNWSKIKKRLKVSIPETKPEGDGDGGDDQGDGENLTPRQRMARGHEKAESARAARRAETTDRGGDDGDD